MYGVTEKGVTKKIERLKCKLSGGTSIYEHKRIRAGPRKTSGRVSSNTTVNFCLFGTGTKDKRDKKGFDSRLDKVYEFKSNFKQKKIFV